MKKTLYQAVCVTFTSIVMTTFYGRVLPGNLEWAEIGHRVWFTIGGIMLMVVAEWVGMGSRIGEDE